ncbi:MAG: DNA polymerase III subunit gamma/tau [Bacteroides sp.]|jgi:DNA polymerase-3 subunit gamma/tau|nr:DNA polymerase III subunit gamma/tau [Bacteroides sp.]MCI1684136.1 DNA polymerase III subunit gamma/tau [Bacteroides sp.]
MENYIVSARKYRPATFDSVIGQHALTTTLKNAITSGKLAHAYLFCGPRGVGKTTCARIFAKTINCMNPTTDGEACNQCESCTAFNEQRSYNIHELDAASNNSVDDIRQLVEQVRIPPQIGKYKVYIIDEVHMLSASAFNAFLKTLEEPPHHAIFILATTEKHKILPTILSRCQIYDFNRINVEDTIAHLSYVATKEGIEAEPEALNIIALKADGGMRDALSIFDQVVSFTGGHITYQSVIENLNVLDYEYYFRLTDYFLDNNVSESLLLLNDVLNKGFDANHFITGLSSHFRDLLVSKDPVTLPLLEVGSSIRLRYQAQAGKCPLDFLYKAMKLCNDCDLNYRLSKNKRLLVELTLIQIAQLMANETNNIDDNSSTNKIKPISAKAVNQQPPTNDIPPTQEKKPLTSNKPQTISEDKHTAPIKATLGNSTNISIAASFGQEKGKKAPTIKIPNLGISIKHPGIEKEEQPASSPSALPESKEKEDFLFNEKDVNFYWQEYAASLPQEQIALAKRMQVLHLSMLNNITFEIVVDNDIAAKEFSELIPTIQNYLRNRLRNQKASMTVRVSAPTENVRAYNRVEKFQIMTQKNETLLKLKEEFGLELY